MSANRSCVNCKYSYVDDIFYEYCCRLADRYPDLDDEGWPIENTNCDKWEEETTNND